MASFLESFGPALGTALKVAGTGMSPQAAKNFQRQTELSNTRKMEVDKLVMGLLATAAANGQPGANEALVKQVGGMGGKLPEGFDLGVDPKTQLTRQQLEANEIALGKVRAYKEQLSQYDAYVGNLPEKERPSNYDFLIQRSVIAANNEQYDAADAFREQAEEIRQRQQTSPYRKNAPTIEKLQLARDIAKKEGRLDDATQIASAIDKMQYTDKQQVERRIKAAGHSDDLAWKIANNVLLPVKDDEGFVGAVIDLTSGDPVKRTASPEERAALGAAEASSGQLGTAAPAQGTTTGLQTTAPSAQTGAAPSTATGQLGTAAPTEGIPLGLNVPQEPGAGLGITGTFDAALATLTSQLKLGWTPGGEAAKTSRELFRVLRNEAQRQIREDRAGRINVWYQQLVDELQVNPNNPLVTPEDALLKIRNALEGVNRSIYEARMYFRKGRPGISKKEWLDAQASLPSLERLQSQLISVQAAFLRSMGYGTSDTFVEEFKRMEQERMRINQQRQEAQ